MYSFLEPMLYIDAQAAVPVCFCQICGGECYAPRLRCIDCEEELS